MNLALQPLMKPIDDMVKMSHVTKKTCLRRFATRLDTNLPAQIQFLCFGFSKYTYEPAHEIMVIA